MARVGSSGTRHETPTLCEGGQGASAAIHIIHRNSGGVNCSANRNWLVIQTNMQADSHTSPLLQQPYLPIRYYHCVTPVESKLDILNYQDILQGGILYRPLDL